MRKHSNLLAMPCPSNQTHQSHGLRNTKKQKRSPYIPYHTMAKGLQGMDTTCVPMDLSQTVLYQVGGHRY